jgi:hypothetical protein
MTRPPDSGTDLTALLAAATVSGERRRAMIEPRLAAREAAAREIETRMTQLVESWRDLSGQSQALLVELRQCGIEKVPPARIDMASLAAAVATELWRLSTGPHPGSPLALPCVCSGVVNRPDTLLPLADLIREANAIVRNLVA